MELNIVALYAVVPKESQIVSSHFKKDTSNHKSITHHRVQKSEDYMKIYMASSWKNADEVQEIANYLRQKGHEVDDFTDDSRGRYVFFFKDLPDYENLNAITLLEHEPAKRAFVEDRSFIEWADVILLLLPCGRSAHLEAGYAKGLGKKLIIYQPSFQKGEFDVMYGFADLITDDFNSVMDFLKKEQLGKNIKEKRETCFA